MPGARWAGARWPGRTPEAGGGRGRRRRRARRAGWGRLERWRGKGVRERERERERENLRFRGRPLLIFLTVHGGRGGAGDGVAVEGGHGDGERETGKWKSSGFTSRAHSCFLPSCRLHTMAAARPLVTVQGLDGAPAEQTALPAVFLAPIRPDVISLVSDRKNDERSERVRPPPAHLPKMGVSPTCTPPGRCFVSLGRAWACLRGHSGLVAAPQVGES